jgi:hypothetical protein
MKKLAIFLAIMLIPFSAFALDTISDSDLDSVTGQAGVSIFTSSIQIVKTGITTTYTDSNGSGNTYDTEATGSFTIVDEGSTTQIFFHGFDPLEIDVVSVADVIDTVNRVCGSTSAFNGYGDYGESAVQITLPNAIEIINVNGATKTYYMSDATALADDSNELIQITTTGGTTTISSALMKGVNVWAGNYFQNGYDGALAAAGVHHGDQVKILITSHD